MLPDDQQQPRSATTSHQSNPQPAETPKHPAEPSKRPADTDNAFDNSAMIIQRIITVLRPLAGGEGSEDLTLWVKEDNLVLQHLIKSKKFAQNLSLELLEARLDQFARGRLNIETGAVPEGLHAPTILPGQLFLSFGKEFKPKPKGMTKAWLHLVEGTGNALQPDFELDAAQSKLWHIGRGSMHKESQSIRRNAYVVNDGDPEANSGLVSHAHCDIVYNDGVFYLQACPGGCRNEGGSATKVLDHRTDRLTELHSCTIRRPLRPGDIIELSKAVQIQFSDH